MNHLIDKAIRSRTTSAEVTPMPSMVYCDAGAIAVRLVAHPKDHQGLIEAVVLPLLAQLDFVISIDAYVAHQKPDDPTMPSENPEAEEVVVYYLFEDGDPTEQWALPIHRGDQGAITHGKPWQVHQPAMTSPAAQQLVQVIGYYADRGTHPRDRRLEHELAAALSRLGHHVAWEGLPTS